MRHEGSFLATRGVVLLNGGVIYGEQDLVACNSEIQSVERAYHSYANQENGASKERAAPESFHSKKSKRFLFPEVPRKKRGTTKIKEEIRMAMTQERAYEIAYLGCVREVMKHCDTKGINDVNIVEKLRNSEVEEEFAEDIANILHIERTEALEFTRFVFMDVVKALIRRKVEAAIRTRDLSL